MPSYHSTCVEGVSTPPKKRRLTVHAMLSDHSSIPTDDDGNTLNKHAVSPPTDEQSECRRRMLASRNVFEVSFHMIKFTFRLYYGFTALKWLGAGSVSGL